jgi:hypothetical protein
MPQKPLNKPGKKIEKKKPANNHGKGSTQKKGGWRPQQHPACWVSRTRAGPPAALPWAAGHYDKPPKTKARLELYKEDKVGQRWAQQQLRAERTSRAQPGLRRADGQPACSPMRRPSPRAST